MNLRKLALISALCLVILLFAGCAPADEENDVPEHYNKPQNEQNTDTEVGGPVGQEPETPGIKLNDAELKSLDKMLFGNKQGENWIYRSIPVQWSEDPKAIDLSVLFRNGFEGDCGNFTDEELMFLSETTGISISDLNGMWQMRLPEAKMDSVLREYYGITLMDSYRNGLGNLLYWSGTNSYYVLGDTRAKINFGLHSAYEQENGGFIIYYGSSETSPSPENVMCLAPNEFGSYTIMYNKPVTGK